jgi:hypothetical protein
VYALAAATGAASESQAGRRSGLDPHVQVGAMVDRGRQAADMQAVHAPGRPGHPVRGLLGEEVRRRIRPGPDAMPLAEAPLLLEALLLPMDAAADDGDDPGHHSDDEDPGRGDDHDPRHVDLPRWGR